MGSNLPPGVSDADIDRQYDDIESVTTDVMLSRRWMSDVRNSRTDKTFKEWLKEYRGEK